MPIYKTKAIVLRNIILSETDKLITFMTADHGKIKCAAKAARRLKNRYGAALEPLSFISLIYFGKETQSIYRINHCEIIQSFQSIRDDINKIYTGLYFVELTDNMTGEGHREPEIFDLLLKSLHEMKERDDPENLCRLFELRMLSKAGYNPQLNHCILCKKIPQTSPVGFSYNKCGIICKSCWPESNPDVKLLPGTHNYLKKLQTIEIKNSDRLKIQKSSEEEVEKLAHRMILSHLGKELKSYPFIKQMAETG